MSKLGEFVKENRKMLGLTQEQFSIRSDLGLRFIRELEQGKTNLMLDKVNVALNFFGYEALPVRKEKDDE